jgi:hypothetical protein
VAPVLHGAQHREAGRQRLGGVRCAARQSSSPVGMAGLNQNAPSHQSRAGDEIKITFNLSRP